MQNKNNINKVVFEFPDIKATAFSLDTASYLALLAGRHTISLIDTEHKTASKALIKQFQKNGKWDIINLIWINDKEIQNSKKIILTYNQWATLYQLSDSLSLKELGTIKRHTRLISDADVSTFLPNLTATSSLDKFCYVWDVRCFAADIKPAKILTSITPISQTKWSKVDENVMATAHETDIHVWDIRNTKCPTHYIHAHISTIHSLDWWPNRTGSIRLASAGQDNTVKVWAGPSYQLIDVVYGQGATWRVRHLPDLEDCLSTIPIPSLRPGTSNVSLWSLKRTAPTFSTSNKTPALQQTASLATRNPINQPIQYFVGPRDFVIDFAWRRCQDRTASLASQNIPNSYLKGARGIGEEDISDDESVDYFSQNITHQLVSWGRDHCLRIWDLSPDLSKLFSPANKDLSDHIFHVASQTVPPTDVKLNYKIATKASLPRGVVDSQRAEVDSTSLPPQSCTIPLKGAHENSVTTRLTEPGKVFLSKSAVEGTGALDSEPDDSDALPNPMAAITKRMNRFISTRALTATTTNTNEIIGLQENQRATGKSSLGGFKNFVKENSRESLGLVDRKSAIRKFHDRASITSGSKDKRIEIIDKEDSESYEGLFVKTLNNDGVRGSNGPTRPRIVSFESDPPAPPFGNYVSGIGIRGPRDYSDFGGGIRPLWTIGGGGKGKRIGGKERNEWRVNLTSANYPSYVFSIQDGGPHNGMQPQIFAKLTLTVRVPIEGDKHRPDRTYPLPTFELRAKTNDTSYQNIDIKSLENELVNLARDCLINKTGFMVPCLKHALSKISKCNIRRGNQQHSGSKIRSSNGSQEDGSRIITNDPQIGKLSTKFDRPLVKNPGEAGFIQLKPSQSATAFNKLPKYSNPGTVPNPRKRSSLSTHETNVNVARNDRSWSSSIQTTTAAAAAPPANKLYPTYYEKYSDDDQNVPFPRTSGARFSGPDFLVCFTRPKRNLTQPPHPSLPGKSEKDLKCPLTGSLTPRALSALSTYVDNNYSTRWRTITKIPPSTGTSQSNPSSSISHFYAKGFAVGPEQLSQQKAFVKVGHVVIYHVSRIVAPTDPAYLMPSAGYLYRALPAPHKILGTAEPRLLELCELNAANTTTKNVSSPLMTGSHPDSATWIEAVRTLKFFWFILGTASLQRLSPTIMDHGYKTILSQYIDKNLMDPLLTGRDIRTLAVFVTFLRLILKPAQIDVDDDQTTDHLHIRTPYYVDNDNYYYLLPPKDLSPDGPFVPEAKLCTGHRKVRTKSPVPSPVVLGVRKGGKRNSTKSSGFLGSSKMAASTNTTPSLTLAASAISSKISSAFPSVVFGKQAFGRKQSSTITTTLTPIINLPPENFGVKGASHAPVKIDGVEIVVNEMKKSSSWCQLNYMTSDESGSSTPTNATDPLNESHNNSTKTISIPSSRTSVSFVRLETPAQLHDLLAHDHSTKSRDHHVIQPAVEVVSNCHLSSGTLRLYDHYLTSYSDILYSRKRWYERAALLKFTNYPPIPHRGLVITTWCNRCRVNVEGSQCPKCLKLTLACSICRLPIKGLCDYCSKCGHAGHPHHLKRWFRSHKNCPSGCGCNCLL